MVTSNLEDEDKVLVDLLIEAGLPKEWALILVFIRCRGETTFIAIKIFTGLSHPDVSCAIKELRLIKWVVKKDHMHEGKGRPFHSYRLAIPFEEMIDELEKEERKRIEQIENNIEQLKAFIADSGPP